MAMCMVMSNCTSDSGSPGPQPEASASPNNPPMDSGTNAVNNNNNDKSVAGNLPYSLKSAMNTMMAEMNGIELTNNFDADFAKIMVAHHEGALGMCQLELQGGHDSVMKSLAENIRDKQQQQINDLKNSVDNKKISVNAQGRNELQKWLNSMKSNMDSIQAGDNMDMSFASMMKAHHQQGIGLAKMELSHGNIPKVRQLAQNIIADAQKEMRQFEKWISSKAPKK
jgi:uncharacterized protein (DUF305 family)